MVQGRTRVYNNNTVFRILFRKFKGIIIVLYHKINLVYAGFFQFLHWRKFRIEIHSETIRNFPNHSGICIRTKQFQFDLIRVLVFNPNQSEIYSKSIRTCNPMYPIESGQSELIRINPNFQSE